MGKKKSEYHSVDTSTPVMFVRDITREKMLSVWSKRSAFPVCIRLLVHPFLVSFFKIL